MKIDEFLASKAKLTEQLQELQDQLDGVRSTVLEEIKRYIKEFDITFIQMQELYQSLNLSTATIQFVKATKGNPRIDSERKGYVYYDTTTGKWFNGYNKLPPWFKVEKADSYLISGKKHTPIVLDAMKAYGKGAIKQAFTEAQLSHWKNTASQWEKLFDSKKLNPLKTKIQSETTENAEQISNYCSQEVADFIFDTIKH